MTKSLDRKIILTAPETFDRTKLKIFTLIKMETKIMHTPEKSVFIEDNATRANVILNNVLSYLETRTVARTEIPNGF